MNDFKRAPDQGRVITDHSISEDEAVRITQTDDLPELIGFVAALKMVKPVSTERAARLIKHIVKQQMISNSVLIADQMRDDGWDTNLSDGESLALVAERASDYFATHAGISLFNFFVKTFAKTTGNMFE
jgi:hypothetical protein